MSHTFNRIMNAGEYYLFRSFIVLGFFFLLGLRKQFMFHTVSIFTVILVQMFKFSTSVCGTDSEG